MAMKRKILSGTWKLSVFLKRLYRTQKQIFWVLSAMAFTMSFYYLYKVDTRNNQRVVYITEELIKEKLTQSLLEDKGAGCEMPYLDPFSEVAMSYNEELPQIVCEGLDWVECYQSQCSVVDKILKTMDRVVCNYKDIVYINDQEYIIGDAVRISGGDKYTLNRSDHIKVSCSGMDKKGLGILSTRWFGYKAGLRPVPITPPGKGRENTINIMVLCFDSISHNGFIRKMPKTYKVLQEEINAVIMKSYNIVGEGTFSTLYPMLTGLDLPKWHSNPKTDHVDHKAFLFHQLKVDGYRTAYLEDMPWIGTFQRHYKGFDACPADHYLRSFFMEESSNGRKWWHGVRARFCIGSTPQYDVMINLTKQFLHLDGKRFCFTFIADISHDDFNQISSADDSVVEFLRGFKRQGYLEDTLLIVMGDHGAKYDNIRKSYQGRIEERLPLVTITLPSKLMKERPEALVNLKANAEVLTTPYDLHTTILDVVDLKKYSNSHKVPGSDLTRGMSMLGPIPKSRSCGEAGILPHWCACAKWRNVTESDPTYKRAAVFLLDYINNITEEKRSKCAKRTLKTIHWVFIHMPNQEMLKKMEKKSLFGEGKQQVRSEEEYYQVKLVAAPANAMYEASMRYYVKENYFTLDDKDVSRISAYGHEPDCVLATHPHLNKYCYCVNNTSKLTAERKVEEIPKSRSCGEAGILPHWCACAKWRNVTESDPTYKRAAVFLLDYINNITEEKRSKCAKRTLKTIHWVFIHMPNQEMLKKMEKKSLFGEGKQQVRSEEEYYQVKLVAAPANAMYEASMRYYVKENYFTLDDKDVSRISAYGHEPDCVLATHPHLNKYCYCVNNTSKLTAERKVEEVNRSS